MHCCADDASRLRAMKTSRRAFSRIFFPKLNMSGEELFWFPSFMGITDFILAGEGDLYDMNAHIIIRNKVVDFGTICSMLYSIYWFCVFHISKLTNIYSYSMNAPLSLFYFCHVC